MSLEVWKSVPQGLHWGLVDGNSDRPLWPKDYAYHLYSLSVKIKLFI